MHRSLHRLALLTAVCAMTAGCDREPAGPAPEYDLAIETDRAWYSLATDRVVRISLTNRSSRDVYLPMDSYVVYERLQWGDWREPMDWFVVDGIGRSFPVAREAVHEDDLDIQFYLRDRPGVYRFRYYVYSDASASTLLPLDERVSQPFTIVP